jgi:glycosidase
MPEYAGSHGFFSMIFDFSYQDPYDVSAKPWYVVKPWTVDEWKRAIFTSQRQQQSINVWSPTHLENHDSARSVSRLLPAEAPKYESKTMLGALFFFLRGTPFLYQGQEIGMTNYSLGSIDDYDDVFSKGQYQVAIYDGMSKDDALKAVAFRSRDNARTPMQWTRGRNAGFTQGTPWLPVNPNHETINVKDESDRKRSVLNFYRAMIHLRSKSSYTNTLVNGAIEPVYENQTGIVAYDRVWGRTRIRVICNFQAISASLNLNTVAAEILLANADEVQMTTNNGAITLKLDPYETVIIAMSSQ